MSSELYGPILVNGVQVELIVTDLGLVLVTRITRSQDIIAELFVGFAVHSPSLPEPVMQLLENATGFSTIQEKALCPSIIMDSAGRKHLID